MKKIPIAKKSISVKEAMRIIDKCGLGAAFVVDDEEKFIGIITDGDIRRHILNSNSLSAKLASVTNKNALVVQKNWSEKDILDYLQKNNVKTKISRFGIICLPVIDDERKVIGFCHYSESGKLSTELEEPKNSAVKRVLVVGGAGYIGSVLCRKLLGKGYIVRVLDNTLYGDYGIAALP